MNDPTSRCLNAGHIQGTSEIELSQEASHEPGGRPLRFSGREPEALLDRRKQVSLPECKDAEIDRTLAVYERRKKDSLRISGALSVAGMERRAWRMAECGNGRVRSVCLACGTIQEAGPLRVMHCQDRLCPSCAARRAGRLADRWSKAIGAFQAVEPVHSYFVTLTHVDTDTLQEFKCYSRAKRLIFRHPFWKRYGLAGGIAAAECKVGKNSGKWHMHWHCLVFTRQAVPLIETGSHAGEWQNEVNQQLSEAWQSVTEDSFIVKGQAWLGNAQELLKYVCKAAGQLPDEKLVELARWSKGKRFLSTFGKCYNSPVIREALQACDDEDKDEPGGLHQCECGCREFECQVMRWNGSHYVIESCQNISLDDFETDAPSP